MGKVVLCIGDLHAPYIHKDAVGFLKAIKAKYKPTDVIFMGDEMDAHASSYHEHNPDLDAAGIELEKAKATLRPLFKLFPKATILESNHGSLMYRKALTAGIPKSVLKGYRDVLGAPKGWVWKYDHVEHTAIGPVYFHHGKSGVPEKLSKNMAMSAVQAHYHSKAYISYWASPIALYFDANVGCLIDRDSMAFAYEKSNLPKPILGCMVIIAGIPKWIPMVLKKGGRWVGHL